ncbi:MAG TPA: hypothetical protein VF329_13870 [Gammaproteobacteria bacterium]
MTRTPALLLLAALLAAPEISRTQDADARRAERDAVAELEPAVDVSGSPPPAPAPASAAAGESVGLEPAIDVGEPPPPAPESARAAAAAGAGRASAYDTLDLGTTSITGNRELPKVLYIVPWKRSDLGDLVGRPVNSLLDEVLAPVDPEVFERHLDYYQALYGQGARAATGDAKSEEE